MKQIEAENKNVINTNEINTNEKEENKNEIKLEVKKPENEKNESSLPLAKTMATQNANTKPIEEANANVSTINVSKEEKDLLLLENAGLKKDNELYKTKLLSIEKELRTIKLENNKLKNENATSLQELIKKKRRRN
jgi:hypothetical protein